MTGRRLFRIAGAALPLALVLIWEIAWRRGLLDQNALPAPSNILAACLDPAFLAEIGAACLVTLRRILIGFALGGTLGCVLGFACGHLPRLGALTSTAVEFLRPMPSVALIPVGILFLGAGDGLCQAVAAWACSWPAFVNASRGARAAPQTLLDSARTLGAGPTRLMLRVVLPAALPAAMSGLRVGLGVAAAVTVITEMAASGTGLGAFILASSLAYRLAWTYAAILAVGVLGFGLQIAFSLLENRCLAWEPSRAERAGRTP